MSIGNTKRANTVSSVQSQLVKIILLPEVFISFRLISDEGVSQSAIAIHVNWYNYFCHPKSFLHCFSAFSTLRSLTLCWSCFCCDYFFHHSSEWNRNPNWGKKKNEPRFTMLLPNNNKNSRKTTASILTMKRWNETVHDSRITIRDSLTLTFSFTFPFLSLPKILHQCLSKKKSWPI